MISILLHLPFLISVPFFFVGIYSTLATQLVAFTAGCAYWNFKFFMKTKCYQNPQLAGAFLRLHVDVDLPVCEHLCTVSASVLEGISGCCVTQEENRYCRRKVVRPRCHFICRFNAHRITFLKLVAVKEKL